MIQAHDSNRRRSNFRTWMERRGLNPHAIGKATGIPSTTIYSYTQGKTHSLTGQTQDRIAAAYQSSVAEIFGHSNARWLPLSGTFRVDGGLRRFEPGEDRTVAPEWLASADAVVACRVGDLKINPSAARWLVLFKEARKVGKIEALHNCWVLAELTNGDRVFSCVRPTKDGWMLEPMAGGTMIPSAETVRLHPLVAVIPTDDPEPIGRTR